MQEKKKIKNKNISEMEILKNLFDTIFKNFGLETEK